MATATRPVTMAEDGLGIDRSKARALGWRGFSSSTLASDVSGWNWATVGGVGWDDLAQVHGRGEGETAGDFSKSLMR